MARHACIRGCYSRQSIQCPWIGNHSKPMINGQKVGRHVQVVNQQQTCPVPLVMLPTGSGDPDCMKPARKRPSLFPPFVIICSETEMAPDDCPQLTSRIRQLTAIIEKVSYIVTLDSSPPNAPMYLFTHFSARRSRIEVTSVGHCKTIGLRVLKTYDLSIPSSHSHL